MFRISRIRRLMTVVAAGAALLVSGVVSPSAEAVVRRPERQLIRLINKFRVENNENRLNHKLNLHRLAEKTAKKMAEQETILHTDLDDVPCNGRKGEVAGVGDGVGGAFRNLKNSPQHRAIILRSYWKKMGVGVARGDNDLTYVAVIFCD